MGNICRSERREYTYVSGKRDLHNLSQEEVVVVQWEDDLEFQHIYFDQFELQVQRHGYTGLLSEAVLAQEVERVPIKVKDF